MRTSAYLTRCIPVPCMPRFLTPNQSTQHRVAAIALYRALLARCTSTPLPDEHRSSIYNAVRNKFRRNRKLSSPYLLGVSFHAGYEALDHLDAAAAGNTASTAFIISLASTLPSGMCRPPPVKPKTPQPPPHPSKQALACLPPECAELTVRPRKTVSGVRRVPILCSANGVPFLRMKKPQPVSLSRILRQKIDRRQKVFDEMVLLDNYWRPIADAEDDWDDLVIAHCGTGAVAGRGAKGAKAKEKEVGKWERELWDGGSWVEEIDKAKVANKKVYIDDMNRDRETARKMLRIIDLETVLARKEGVEVVRGRPGRLRMRKMSE